MSCCGGFNVDRYPAGKPDCLLNIFGLGPRNYFKVDITVKPVPVAKDFSSFDDLFHGISGTLADTGTKKQAFNIVPAVKFQEQSGKFLGCKTSSGYVALDTVRAVKTVFLAGVGLEHLKQ